MALNIYKISEFNHKAKIVLFDELCKLLAERCEDGKEDCIVVGNYNVEGVEIDALVVTHHGVMVFDFKNGVATSWFEKWESGHRMTTP